MTDNTRVVDHSIRPGREFVTYDDGSQWTRKLDRTTGAPNGDWTQVETPPVDDTVRTKFMYLSVVLEHQAEGEPKHWSLFSHCPTADGTGEGRVWMVTGDAEQMHYAHVSGVDLLRSEGFHWHQVVNTDLSEAQFNTVERIAREEVPPSAVSRREVTENCQGWVIRVLRRLVGEGIVKEDTVTMLQQYMDPIN